MSLISVFPAFFTRMTEDREKQKKPVMHEEWQVVRSTSNQNWRRKKVEKSSNSVNLLSKLRTILA